MAELTTEGATALSRAIQSRLMELGLTQVQAAKKAGVSDLWIRHLQTGSRLSYRDSTLGKVSRALWDDGLYISREILSTAGYEVAGDGVTNEPTVEELAADIAELRVELARLRAERDGTTVGKSKRAG